MRRREFVAQIAFAYAMFEADVEAHHPEGKPQPLDRSWAFHRGRTIIETGGYKPRRSALGLDYARVAQEARQALPYQRGIVREYHVTQPERRCQVCGGTIRLADS